MNINRNNYEQYFLDFSEGNLSPEEKEVLSRFLKFNPDLQTELNQFVNYKLLPEEHSFPHKNQLKKELPSNNTSFSESDFDMYCIAYLEGDLNSEQEKDLLNYLNDHPEKNSILDTYRATKLHPENVVYKEKSQLRKKKPLLINWRIVAPLAAAAAIALMLFIGPDKTSNIELIAENTKTPIPEEEKIVESPEDKKPMKKIEQATIQVIKNRKVPVPKSNYKKDPPQDKKASESTQNVEKQNRKIASFNFKGKSFQKDVITEYDKIIPESIAPLSINRSSLTLVQIARQEFQRVSEVMDEEDVLIWSIASNGLKEINKRTGSEMKLLASKDSEGSISGVQFKSRYLNIVAPISKDEE